MDKKKPKINFTNESLSKKFKSNFDLVNYAISLAENMIKTGRDTRVKSDTQNRAMLILEEISEGKDQFDEIKDSNHKVPLNGISQQEIIEEKVEKKKFRINENHHEN